MQSLKTRTQGQTLEPGVHLTVTHLRAHILDKDLIGSDQHAEGQEEAAGTHL